MNPSESERSEGDTLDDKRWSPGVWHLPSFQCSGYQVRSGRENSTKDDFVTNMLLKSTYVEWVVDLTGVTGRWSI